MKKLLIIATQYLLLSCRGLQGDTQQFKDAYIDLASQTPTMLDLKVHKLDFLLRAPREFHGSVSCTFSLEEGSKFEWVTTYSLTVPSFGECEKDLLTPRLIFTIHLPINWLNATDYRYDESMNEYVPDLQGYQIIRNLFEELVKKAQRYVHESFSPEDALVFIKAPLSQNSAEELIVIYENGIPLYQDAFFGCHWDFDCSVWKEQRK